MFSRLYYIAKHTRLRLAEDTQTNGTADKLWGQLLDEQFDQLRTVLRDESGALGFRQARYQVAHLL